MVEYQCCDPYLQKVAGQSRLAKVRERELRDRFAAWVRCVLPSVLPSAFTSALTNEIEDLAALPCGNLFIVVPSLNTELVKLIVNSF